jgi:hypothetical protein
LPENLCKPLEVLWASFEVLCRIPLASPGAEVKDFHPNFLVQKERLPMLEYPEQEEQV